MYNVTVGRFADDPTAQGVVRPSDGSWQLVVDKDGYPHLYLRVPVEPGGDELQGATIGLLCLEDLLPDDLKVRDLMQGSFGGSLPPDEEAAAHAEYLASVGGMVSGMSETRLTADDVIQLRRIHAGERHTVMPEDVVRWRAAGWLEPEPSWNLTRLGLAAICGGILPDVRPPSEIRRDTEAHVAAHLARDPGPDAVPPPAVRPRTPEEVLPARQALRRLSDALLRHENPGLRADGRLAWLHSVLPLSGPEEVGDALAFAGDLLAKAGSPDLYRGMTIPEEQTLRQAVLGTLSELGLLVDDMRCEAEGSVTDRRRSVTQRDRLTHLECEWSSVPVVEIELLYEAAASIAEYPDFKLGSYLQAKIDQLAAIVARVAEIRKVAASPAWRDPK